MTHLSWPSRKMVPAIWAAVILTLGACAFAFFSVTSSKRPASRIRDNEAAAVGAIRVFSTGLVALAASNTGAATSPQHPDASGYAFHIEKGPSENGVPRYAIAAVPIRPGKSGNRSFFTDECGVIRVSDEGQELTHRRRLCAETPIDRAPNKDCNLYHSMIQLRT